MKKCIYNDYILFISKRDNYNYSLSDIEYHKDFIKSSTFLNNKKKYYLYLHIVTQVNLISKNIQH